MEDLISILVPVYNVEQYLDRCVESIIAQTYSNLQIILVDDGSTDKSGVICDLWEKKDPRIEVIHKLNGGLTSSRKAGFDIAKGEYISFVDSDDFLEKTYVEDLYNNLVQNNSDISICGYFLDDKDSRPINIKANKSMYKKEAFVKELVLPEICALKNDKTKLPSFIWMRMFKKTVIDDKCFVSEREFFTEDLFFNLESYKNCEKVSVICKPLYHYCMNSNSLTHIYRKDKCQMEIQRLNRIIEELKDYNALDEKRINLISLKIIGGCINNSYKLNEYKKFIKDLKPLINNEQIRKVSFKSAFFELSVSERVYCICYKFRVLYFAYLLKKFIEGFRNYG